MRPKLLGHLSRPPNPLRCSALLLLLFPVPSSPLVLSRRWWTDDARTAAIGVGCLISSLTLIADGAGHLDPMRALSLLVYRFCPLFTNNGAAISDI